MGVVDRRMELLEHLVRLRRVSRQLPGNRDVAAVRSGIEQELGEAVSQRLAGRLLGVSHTRSRRRWAAGGRPPSGCLYRAVKPNAKVTTALGRAAGRITK